MNYEFSIFLRTQVRAPRAAGAKIRDRAYAKMAQIKAHGSALMGGSRDVLAYLV